MPSRSFSRCRHGYGSLRHRRVLWQQGWRRYGSREARLVCMPFCHIEGCSRAGIVDPARSSAHLRRQGLSCGQHSCARCFRRSRSGQIGTACVGAGTPILRAVWWVRRFDRGPPATIIVARRRSNTFAIRTREKRVAMNSMRSFDKFEATGFALAASKSAPRIRSPGAAGPPGSPSWRP